MPATRLMCALVVIDAVKQDLLPTFGRTAPDIVWDPTAALLKRVEAGETADGIFAIDYAIDELTAAGRLDPASRRPIVQAEFGLAAQPGAQFPRPQDAAELIALLLEVPSIAYSRAGASGIYFEKLIDRLGIGDRVRAKSLVIPAGLTGERVRSGDAVLAVQQMSELRAVEGIEMVGPLPDDCQQTTDFSAAVFADAADPQGAAAFIGLLTSPAAGRSFAGRGLKLRF
ncbi:molybdate ABC transporter substrate-binding protein [Faunimonas sp. B44]|uniref:molybdate ABC transporter substrate-binding protein n=1 Tax=Faunimonas sp. B44 TaxID=3461493 RepID=UPI0040439792